MIFFRGDLIGFGFLREDYVIGFVGIGVAMAWEVWVGRKSRDIGGDNHGWKWEDW